MHVYAISPIDLGWEYLPTVEDVASKMAAAHVRGGPNWPSEVREFLSDYEYALGAALKNGWEGDFRPGHEPRVMALPKDGDPYFQYAFIWKQDNNGTTFVVSPIALPWLR